MTRNRLIPTVTTLAFAASLASAAAREIDFNKHVKPILEAACVSCHNEKKAKGELLLDTWEGLMSGGENGPCVVPGKPEQSTLYTFSVMDPDEDEVMPPKEADRLSKDQMLVLKEWIEQGAKWPKGVTLKQVRRPRFVKDIQPIFEFHCVSCHSDHDPKGDYDMSSLEAALHTGENSPNLVAFDAKGSYLYTSMTLDKDDDDVMPPAKKDGPLPKEEVDLIRLWVEQGAEWPEGIKLTARKKEADSSADSLDLVKAIHARILKNQKAKTEADMKAYSSQIPDSVVKFDMLPIKGGEFVMGSPDGEAGRNADEGPQHKVKISPFWMGKYEVTWNEFELFMYPADAETNTAGADPIVVAAKKQVHACSRPTKPYVEMSFGMGKDNFPAISMTQHAALKYCQWLSAKTGHFYRLPTEAEWEYACRAGTTTAYHFGDDVSKLGEYAWYEANSDWKYQQIGKKKPNPWGLYDMHGNVAEWVLDQYAKDYYGTLNGTAADPLNKPAKLYPRPARGGSWDHDPEFLRSSSRAIQSNADWKTQDPQLPKSIWYHTDAQFLGMRIIRPLEVPSAEEMFEYWSMGRGDGE